MQELYADDDDLDADYILYPHRASSRPATPHPAPDHDAQPSVAGTNQGFPNVSDTPFYPSSDPYSTRFRLWQRVWRGGDADWKVVPGVSYIKNGVVPSWVGPGQVWTEPTGLGGMPSDFYWELT